MEHMQKFLNCVKLNIAGQSVCTYTNDLYKYLLLMITMASISRAGQNRN